MSGFVPFVRGNHARLNRLEGTLSVSTMRPLIRLRPTLRTIVFPIRYWASSVVSTGKRARDSGRTSCSTCNLKFLSSSVSVLALAENQNAFGTDLADVKL